MTFLEELSAAVTRITSIETAAITMIKGMARAVADAKGSAEALDALVVEMNASANALGAAVTANAGIVPGTNSTYTLTAATEAPAAPVAPVVAVEVADLAPATPAAPEEPELPLDPPAPSGDMLGR